MSASGRSVRFRFQKCPFSAKTGIHQMKNQTIGFTDSGIGNTDNTSGLPCLLLTADCGMY
jgi:hypothetical protein